MQGIAVNGSLPHKSQGGINSSLLLIMKALLRALKSFGWLGSNFLLSAGSWNVSCKMDTFGGSDSHATWPHKADVSLYRKSRCQRLRCICLAAAASHFQHARWKCKHSWVFFFPGSVLHIAYVSHVSPPFLSPWTRSPSSLKDCASIKLGISSCSLSFLPSFHISFEGSSVAGPFCKCIPTPSDNGEVFSCRITIGISERPCGHVPQNGHEECKNKHIVHEHSSKDKLHCNSNMGEPQARGIAYGCGNRLCGIANAAYACHGLYCRLRRLYCSSIAEFKYRTRRYGSAYSALHLRAPLLVRISYSLRVECEVSGPLLNW